MGSFIYQWIDVLWLPVAWLVVAPKHRLKALAFVFTCILTLRTQVELIESTGYRTGFLPFMHSDILTRGLIVYSVIIALFLILAHYSPRTDKMIFFAAAISSYLFAFCVSMVIMAL